MNKFAVPASLIYWLCLPVTGMLFFVATLEAVGIAEGNYAGTEFFFLMFFGPIALISPWLGLLVYPVYALIYFYGLQYFLSGVLIVHHGVWLLALAFPNLLDSFVEFRPGSSPLVHFANVHGVIVVLLPFVGFNLLLLRKPR